MSNQDILVEAIRRLDLFHPDKDPLVAWSGLGTRTDYKSVLDDELMEWVSVPAPRCKGWLRLTEDGLTAVNKIRADHGGPMEFEGYHLRIPNSHWRTA